jgi:hypothetical protein
VLEGRRVKVERRKKKMRNSVKLFLSLKMEKESKNGVAQALHPYRGARYS